LAKKNYLETERISIKIPKHQERWLEMNDYNISMFIRYLIDREINRGIVDRRFVNDKMVADMDEEELKE